MKRSRVVMAAVVLVPLLAAAPAAAQHDTHRGFGDVTGGVHKPAIDALAALGVFDGTGCAEGLFCPGDEMKRWTMGVWLVRVLDDAEPPAAAESSFADVDASEWWSPHMERLAELGVTRGCAVDPLRFCPDRPVRRGQMATFLTRAFDLAAAEPARFADTPGHAHQANIDALAAAGVTAGCATDPLRFCPDRPVTRGQMATFLARALGLVEVPQPTDGAGTQSTGDAISIADTPPERVSPAYKAIASGWEHACAIRSDGTVTCWGNNAGGQATDPGGEFASVTAGRWHNCGLRPDRTVACWGHNGNGQIDAPAGEFLQVSAGSLHTCGLRPDGAITCWGDNRVRKAEAPQGEFLSVAAGGEHTCGLRTDGTITCWGDDGSDRRDIPQGDYRAVSAGDSHTCAIRPDDTVTCWGGGFGQAIEDPDGRFRSVRAGGDHSCGLRMDNAIVCWGNPGGEGLTDPPSGDFTAVSAGSSHSCGLRTDGAVACWGDAGYDPTDAPGGTHVSITAGEEHTRGLRPDSTVACWGDPAEGRTYPPTGAFTAVSAARSHTCGLRPDSTVACWGANHVGQTDAPDFEFSAVAAGDWHTCGIRTEGFVLCWGHSGDGQTDGPVGRFSSIASGGRHSCAIRTDGVVLCWGKNDDGQARAPAGNFTDLAAGSRHTCGVRQDQAVVCWGNNDDGQSDPPAGSFTDVAAGRDHSCGVRADGTVACWGANWWGKSDAPTGSFTEVTVGGEHSCGLRTGGTISCWGIDIVGLPPAVERVVGSGQPDPVACRPYGPRQFSNRGVSTAGFPLPENASPSLGTLRVAVLFVDFPDIRAGYSTRVEAAAGLPTAERYLEAMSYGRLDVQFEPINVWLRAGMNHDQYLSDTPVGRAITTGIDQEAVELGDIHGHFRGVHIAMIVMPSTHFGGGNATGTVRSPDGTVGTTRINTFPRDEPYPDPWNWGVLAAHELAHNLGLLDLYPYDRSDHERPEAPSGRAWIQPEIGLMGMQAGYLAPARSRSVAHTWRLASGRRFESHHYFPHAREMLAWSRWQLEWLDPSQVACITGEQATVSLHPVAEPGEGIAMAAIPLSGQEVLVIESRRTAGFDAPYEFVFPGGIETTFPSLLEEGVLVYTVDARVSSGALPAAVAGDEGDGQVDSYPVLGVRDSVTVRGYTITVTGDDGDTHTVTITRTGN